MLSSKKKSGDNNKSMRNYPACLFMSFSDDEAEDEASSEEENDETCAVCGVGGTLICCDNCPLSYHLACAQPPLKKVPKRKWLCQICSGEDSKAGKIKFLAAPKSK